MTNYTKEEIAAVINGLRYQGEPYTKAADMLTQLLDESLRLRKLVPFALSQALYEELPGEMPALGPARAVIQARVISRVSVLLENPTSITELRDRTP